jgi:hypothetical protein
MALTMVVSDVDLANETLVLVAAPASQDEAAAEKAAEKDDIILHTSPIIVGVPHIDKFNVGDQVKITIK